MIIVVIQNIPILQYDKEHTDNFWVNDPFLYYPWRQLSASIMIFKEIKELPIIFQCILDLGQTNLWYSRRLQAVVAKLNS